MRKLFWFTLGFGAAAACLVYGAGPLWCGLSAVLLAAGFLFFPKGTFRKRLFAALALGLVSGILWTGCWSAVYQKPAKAADGQVQTLTFRLLDYPRHTDYGVSADAQCSLQGKPYRVRLYLRQNADALCPGDRLTMAVRLSYTGQQALTQPAAGRLLTAQQQWPWQIEKASGPSLRELPARLRHCLLSAISQALPREEAAFAGSLLLGQTQALSNTVRHDLSRSGLSHVVAVSGMHLSILMGLLLLMTRRRLPVFLLGIPLLFFFSLLTGSSPSAVRAAIMQSLLLLAPLVKREFDSLTALSAAALCILIANPYAAASVSFQLSAGAVLGILLVTRPIYQRICSRCYGSRSKRGVWGSLVRSGASLIAASLGAMVFTLPLTALHFGSVAVYSMLSGFLVLWCVSALFGFGLCACLVALVFPAAGQWLLGWMALPIRYILGVSHLVSDLPYAVLDGSSHWVRLALCAMYLVLMALLLTPKKRPVLAAGCALLCLTVGLTCSRIQFRRLRVTALDVGQGQAVLLESGGFHAMVDCGSSTKNAGEIAAKYISSQGISRLDLLILTHYDQDHINGAADLLRRLPCDTVLLPDIPDDARAPLEEALLACGAAVYYVSRDISIDAGVGQITLFAPSSAAGGNESCLSLLFQAAECDTLITGDLSAESEAQLLARQQLPQLELLIAGHHGSAASTGQALLQQTQPRVVFISVGQNRYGHPSQELLARLEAAGISYYRTDYLGTLTFGR